MVTWASMNPVLKDKAAWVRVPDFDSLPDDQKRIEVTMDALAMLDLRSLYALRGRYVKKYEGESGIGACRVCAIGAVFLTWALRKDGLSEILEDRSGDYTPEIFDILRSLKKAGFSEKILGLMEIAFEGHAHVGLGHLYEPAEWQAAYEFSLGRSDTILRYVLINILNNHGSFQPKDGHQDLAPHAAKRYLAAYGNLLPASILSRYETLLEPKETEDWPTFEETATAEVEMEPCTMDDVGLAAGAVAQRPKRRLRNG